MVNELEIKVNTTIENIDKVDIEKSLDSINDLKNNLENLIQPYPNISSSLTPILDEIENTETELISYKETMNDVDVSSKEIEESYRSIQSRLDTVNLELKKLKKDFLSLPFDIKKDYIFGEISYFRYLTPAIITLILFFIGVVLTTVNIVDERNSKTLFRISTTPLKKLELFGSKFITFLIVGFFEAIYVLLLAIFIFNVEISGNILNVMLVLLLLMASSIGLGLLISSIVRNMRQAVMLVPLVIIPSVLISQTFSPIEVMPKFMQYVAYLSPMFYSNVALREIMIKGSNLSNILNPIIILGCYAIFTLLLGIVLFKKRIE